jgi:hypothetical protein
MNEMAQSAELHEAVQELQRSLGDELAPMMVTDSVLVLMDHPPALVAAQIHAWVTNQFSRRDPKYSFSDYLYHSLKKLHLLSEFDLIDADRLREYLEALGGELLAYCPEAERETLHQQLGQLAESVAVLGSSAAVVETIYQHGGARPASSSPEAGASRGAAEGGAGRDEAVSHGLRRFSLLLERLGHGEGAGTPAPPSAEGEQIRMQALVTAAIGAQSETELQDYLRQLGGTGLDARPEQLFRLLGRNLPAWNLPVLTIAAPGAPGAYASRPAEAMRKMVALADTPEEGSRRFNELLQAAVEQFNEGSLGRAATMLDLAEQLVGAKSIHADVAQTIRKRAHEGLKEDRLRQYTERQEERATLLRVMNFFPALTVAGLLRQLYEETKRERRWLLLMLLEAHGLSARAAALQDLESFARGDRTEEQGFHQRNLIHLLRRISPGETGPKERELDLLTRLSKPENPPILVREAIRALGQLGHPAAERILLGRLCELEAAAVRLGPALAGTNPLLDLLDNATSALAAQRTPSAVSAVVEHGLSEDPVLGNTAARLDVLGFQSLAGAPEALERILSTLQERLPKKILGLVLQKREDLLHLIRALGGTPLPAVRTRLQEIAVKFANQDVGTEAGKTLAGFAEAARKSEQAAPGLAGDIELFGLPGLFQNLSDSKVTGGLTLRNERGKSCGAVWFQGGKIRASEYLHLKGEDAIYQLFQRSEARTFAFRAEPIPPGEEEGVELIEVLPTLLEAMRRHDEYEQTRALVPDGVRLQRAKSKPTPLEDEEDLALTKAVWGRAATGSTPEQCEAAAPTDAYRVRRLLAHWLEGEALQFAATAAA